MNKFQYNILKVVDFMVVIIADFFFQQLLRLIAEQHAMWKGRPFCSLSVRVESRKSKLQPERARNVLCSDCFNILFR